MLTTVTSLTVNTLYYGVLSDQIRSVAQLCPTLCDPMNCSTPGLPVHHQFLEFTETHVHQVSDAIQPSHPLSCPSPLAPNPSQHQSLFQWVNSLHEVAKVLEFQAITKKIPQIQLNWHRKLLKPAKWEQEVIYYVQHKLVYLKINA